MSWVSPSGSSHVDDGNSLKSEFPNQLRNTFAKCHLLFASEVEIFIEM